MIADPVVISSFARTPIGGFRGSLASLTATQLGSAAIEGAVARSGIEPAAVDQVLMGCVLPAGLGQAPARQAALGAGLPESVPATTVNKMCGSGMQTVVLACQALLSGAADTVIAGGMESMSNAPYLLDKHRSGARMGHDRLVDSLYLDGLEDAYEPGRLMGSFAEDAARSYQFTRAEQDEFAIGSLTRARRAEAEGAFAGEIVPIRATSGKTAIEVSADEQPQRADLERIPNLRAAFAEGGTITAANASSISDGAAALLLTRETIARQRGLPVLARVVAHASQAQAPSTFAMAPGPAMRKVLAQAGWGSDEVDLFEVNEAFAVVAMIAMRDLGIRHDKLNVNGGACALGHPIGASGARILATLLNAMAKRGARRGVASICIGGGEALALAVERD
jgi:acetyl-CoA C-acetyltransferase